MIVLRTGQRERERERRQKCVRQKGWNANAEREKKRTEKMHAHAALNHRTNANRHVKISPGKKKFVTKKCI